MKTILFLFSFLFIVTSQISAQISARMMRTPDVSKTQIAFSYGGDIWVVSKKGGIAHKLSSPKGIEAFPKFSPDGSKIAFSGNYNGNIDIYVIPNLGGKPIRITNHPSRDLMLDWYPDGKSILFASSRESGRQRYDQLYKINLGQVLPEKLPVPYGEFGAISPDNNYLAYTPRTRLFRTWKRYRGGMATDIWLFNLKNYSSENITSNAANDELPMWHNNKIYFLSDQGPAERFNIWVYNLSDKTSRQVTFFKEYDIHFPSIGTDDIVFEAAGNLYLLNLKTEKYSEVNITVTTDEITRLPYKKNVKKYIQNSTISPDGNRVIFEARGDIFSVPAKEGVVKNITNTSGIAERFPAWSPDGKSVAFWSDKSGEYELYVKQLNNPVNESRLSNLGKGFKYHLYWSPDSKRLVFVDNAMNIKVFNIAEKKAVFIDKGRFMYEGNLENFKVGWSPDSKWVTYSRGLDNQHDAIFIYDVLNRQTHQVTSGFYSSHSPVFDPEGKYLYYLTDRNFRPVYSSVDNTFSYPNSTKIAAVPLTTEIMSPLAPKNDTVKVEINQKKDKKDGKEGKEKSKKVKVKIDFNNFEQRALILPPKAGNYGNLTAVSGKIIYLKYPNSGSTVKDKAIKYFDFKKREEKTIVPNADSYQISSDGKKLLFKKSKSYFIVDVKPDQKAEKSVPTDQLEMTINPLAEWEQIFNDAWRFERDFFYDPNMHGVDWDKMKVEYGKLVKGVVIRNDLNYILGELIGELSSSHTYRFGGDQQHAKSKNIGLLGIDWSIENGKFRIAKIINDAKWDSNVRSPLKQDGLNVKSGDYILAVNDVPLSVNKSPYSYFEGLADKTIELTINNKPTLKNSRKILVKPIKSESRLRNLAWIESNRKLVEEKTKGEIGYIYVPNTGVEGQNELQRQFLAQTDKKGLIVDERFNSGGQIPDRFIEILNRKPLAFWAVRDGRNWKWPPNAVFGPKVMLINGWSGSGGDAFPDYFRKAGLGPLIGQRTWGGLIGISGAPAFVDGGAVTVPTFRMYNMDGTWFKEGHGVDPDIKVIDDPTLMANGHDPQLEAGIKEVMKLLKTKGSIQPKQPPYQKR
ncbi:hypothetical protein BMS3Abin04_02821 [bacterium BMS3Abin04]|nr:hypothetical protein BMS3Abin04_02821 [bacterium BMS3Abin04]